VSASALPGAGASAAAAAKGRRRAAVVAKGLALRADKVESVTVVPCAFEHFALIAAFGAPERVTVLPATGMPAWGGCPEVRVPREGVDAL